MKKYKVCVTIPEDQLGTIVSLLAGERRDLSVVALQDHTSPQRERIYNIGATGMGAIVTEWAKQKGAEFVYNDSDLEKAVADAGYKLSGLSGCLTKLINSHQITRVRRGYYKLLNGG